MRCDSEQGLKCGNRAVAHSRVPPLDGYPRSAGSKRNGKILGPGETFVGWDPSTSKASANYIIIIDPTFPLDNPGFILKLTQGISPAGGPSPVPDLKNLALLVTGIGPDSLLARRST